MAWTILITDDDPIIRRILRMTIERQGHSVIEAANGVEALSLLAKHHPDLIIMDVMMPKMDGLTACTKIKQNVEKSDIPIIILSANGTKSDIELGYAAGAEIYLQKPVIPSELYQVICQFLSSKSPLPA